MSNDSSKIWIVTEVETIEGAEVIEGERNSNDVGGGFVGKQQITKFLKQRFPLDVASLKSQMSEVIKVLSDISTQAEQQSGFKLDEVELSVEINGEGQVSILGNGGKLGNKGGIKLKFKRATPTN